MPKEHDDSLAREGRNHLPTSIARLRHKSFVGPLAAVIFLLAFAPPASAQTLQGQVTGAGGGSGFEKGTSERPSECDGALVPLIGRYSGSIFELVHQGTYDGVATDAAGLPTGTVASYVGETRVTINTGPYIISPEGTYSDCTTPGEDEINSATIVGNTGTGQVSCPNLDGFWQRRAFDLVEFRLHGRCDVTGNVPGFMGSVQDQDTTHVITGVMHPCYYPVDTNPLTGEPIPLPPPFDDGVPPGGCQIDPDASAILVTDYVVVPEEVQQLNQPLPPL